MPYILAQKSCTRIERGETPKFCIAFTDPTSGFEGGRTTNKPCCLPKGNEKQPMLPANELDALRARHDSAIFSHTSHIRPILIRQPFPNSVSPPPSTPNYTPSLPYSHATTHTHPSSFSPLHSLCPPTKACLIIHLSTLHPSSSCPSGAHFPIFPRRNLLKPGPAYLCDTPGIWGGGRRPYRAACSSWRAVKPPRSR